MPKYEQRDDGKLIGGRTVIYLRALRSRGEPPPDRETNGRSTSGSARPKSGDGSAHGDDAKAGWFSHPRWIRHTDEERRSGLGPRRAEAEGRSIDDRFGHGEVARLEIDAAPEAEGHEVCFVIEHEDGENQWRPYETRTAVVQGGKASVIVALAHPRSAARGSKPAANAAPARFRFHARSMG